jgi:hypothetical protein
LKFLSKKVNLAIIDTDLKIRGIKKYPLSANGRQIDVIHGGENHFMPAISNTSYLEFPSWKRFYLFGERTHKRIYFAMNKAKKCVDFETGEVALPSPEELKKAIGATMLGKLGKPEASFPLWMIYIILLCVLGITLKVFGVIA